MRISHDELTVTCPQELSHALFSRRVGRYAFYDMIRKYISRTVLLLFVLDQLVLPGSLAAALWIKRHWILIDPDLPVRLHIDLFLRLWPFLAAALVLAGAYDLHVAVGRMWPLLRRTLVAAAAMAAVWIGGTFFLKMSDLISYSRAVFSLFLGLTVVGLVGVRLAVAELLRLWQTRTGQCRRVLIIGGDAHGRRLIKNLARQVFAPIRIVGVTGEVDFDDRGTGAPARGTAAPARGTAAPGCGSPVPRLTEEEALQRIRQGEVDHVIVDLPPKRIRLLLRVAETAELEGVPLQLTPAVFPGIHLTPRVDQIGRIPMIELCGGDLPLSGLIAKRAIDLVLSGVGLIVLSPLMLAIAALVKLTSEGPVLYVQQRIGLDGRPFRMFKFRSMRADAESQTGPVWATADDRRSTPVGRVLRRTNLDELPQLFNVLIGNMSLVGPRPERPEFVEQFKPVIERYSHKHWVKPGITGWAQINGWRGPTDLKTRIEHDIYYIERWSLWFDLKILAWTLIGGYKNAH
jgi:Undecaprenyl-phosphate glucose phosphotransferase